MINTAQDGCKVTLHYKGTFEDGVQFDSSHDRGEPMEVLIGSGELIQGFNDALVGMAVAERKTFTLAPQDAIFPEDLGLEEGLQIPLTSPGGQSILATVMEVKEETITADLNHPMAGKTLTFEVEVLTVEANETSSS